MNYNQALAKVVSLLNRQDEVGTRAVGRAMVAIYKRQTADEARGGYTAASNGRGFNKADASRGTYYARWVLSGRKLSGRHLEKARKMALRYRRQLAEDTLATWRERERERAIEARSNEPLRVYYNVTKVA